MQIFVVRSCKIYFMRLAKYQLLQKLHCSVAKIADGVTLQGVTELLCNGAILEWFTRHIQ